MSRGLTALGRGQWETARKNFEAASRLRPDAPEVADGLARVASAERRDLVTAGIDRGRGLEEAERWAEAEQAYAQVLALDPEAAHALVGKERAALRASLDEQLEFHLGNPGRLSSPSVFDDATEVLGEAREVVPPGPRLSDQVERLEELMEAASTPVEVVLESDNATDVVVYRVGRMGTFTRRQLELRPGTYTAVGSRDGYRDIRVQFDVDRAAPRKPVKIVCTEAL
jgi:tetratricopeptide (TPR) repeat protein